MNDDELRKQLEAARERTARLAEETRRLVEETRHVLDITRTGGRSSSSDGRFTRSSASKRKRATVRSPRKSGFHGAEGKASRIALNSLIALNISPR